jgi:anti-sigma B factor antagonist
MIVWWGRRICERHAGTFVAVQVSGAALRTSGFAGSSADADNRCKFIGSMTTPLVGPVLRDQLLEKPKLEVRHEVADGVALCRIAGKIDALTGPNLQAAALSAINGGNTRIIFDMREVTYISSAGLRVVVLTAKHAKAASGGLALFGLQPAISEVFEITGLGAVIPIASNEAEARSKLRA